MRSVNMLFVSVVVLSGYGAVILAEDCNHNAIDDADELVTCPIIEVVFLVDTSLSTQDEITSLCKKITNPVEPYGAIELLTQSGLTVDHEIFIMAEGGEICPCCTDTVTNVYGSCTSCLPEVLGTCDNEGNLEDWGPATAIVAANKDWGPGPRIIVPISDEGPRCGDPVDNDDQAAIDHAIPVVFDNQVIVLPLLAVGTLSEVVVLAQELAAGGAPGGNVVFRSTDIADEQAGCYEAWKLI